MINFSTINILFCNKTEHTYVLLVVTIIVKLKTRQRGCDSPRLTRREPPPGQLGIMTHLAPTREKIFGIRISIIFKIFSKLKKNRPPTHSQRGVAPQRHP